MAATLVLEPIFEADFHPCSYGFRPKRNATQALERLRLRGARGGNHVLDADIRVSFAKTAAPLSSVAIATGSSGFQIIATA